MDKTSQKVTKDPKRQERGKKSHETYMKRLKEKILEDNQLPTPPPTDRPPPSTTSSTGNSMPSTPFYATRSNDTYVYGIGILAVLAIILCVFFVYNTSQPKNKKLVTQVGHCIFKAKHVACKITITSFRCFFNLK